MPDEFGRVHPVAHQFLDRKVREEPYPGRHPRKHAGHPQDSPETDDAESPGSGESDSTNHIDVRI
jgi:hypothetical protein